MMQNLMKVPTQQLTHQCDPAQFTFETTADLACLIDMIGQSRATEAIDFGVNMIGSGYNLYVMGPSGVGKYTFVHRFLDEHAKKRPTGSDWAYLHNFTDSQNPLYLSLPAGQGRQLRHDIEKAINSLIEELPRALDDDYYHGRIRSIDEASRKHRVSMFAALQAEADKKGILLLRMQDGSYAFAAKHDGEPMTTDDFEQLPVDQQEETEDVIASLHDELQHILLELRDWERNNHEKISSLNDEVAMEVITKQVDTLRHAYPQFSKLQTYFDAMQKDIRSNVHSFVKPEDALDDAGATSEETVLRRYQINLIVDHHELNGAPIIYDSLPSHQSLLGCVENMAMMGALVTDFSLIKAGAIHRSNGGYLILDAQQLLLQPYAWEGLKRALRAKKIAFDSLERMYSLVTTVSLEPEPIPLDVKIILLGDRSLYYQLFELDPEFAELFKVVVDFEDEMKRDDDSHLLYARFLATTVQSQDLLHLDKQAVARVIEHGARSVEDGEKVSLHQGEMTDLLRESTYWARKQGEQLIGRHHVEQAINSRYQRMERMTNQLYEQIKRKTIYIDVVGEKIAQINALSVLSAGNFSFGQPSRLTASCRYGDGDIIDIEREVELGGDIHSKGIMIMSGYLGATYAKNKPLSMSASLVFEQSYGEVDGDSATVAELCVLLSAIAEKPLKQSIAITGSMNQHGDVQVIGGINEKIEGFFDVCQHVDFTGEQGVIIPQENIKHLMLRQDVIDAVEKGEFHIYAIEKVEQALALLTDLEVGELDEQGQYPEGSFNAAVAQRIQLWLDVHKHERDSNQDDE